MGIVQVKQECTHSVCTHTMCVCIHKYTQMSVCVGAHACVCVELEQHDACLATTAAAATISRDANTRLNVLQPLSE